MTHSAGLFLDAYGSAPPPILPLPPARRRWNPVVKGAALTTAAVTAGFGIATAALPPTQTPGYVAAAFVTAWIEDDASAARSFLCQSNRAARSDRFISEQLALGIRAFLPESVDVVVDDVSSSLTPSGPVLEVALTLTADGLMWEGWAIPADVPVVREGSEFRVCFAEDAAT
jgi:hypothetical protein